MMSRLSPFLFLLPLAGAGQVPETPKDAIRAVLDAQVKAWNRGDLSTFMQGYWQAPELTFFSGNTKTRGWQATLERYQKKYQGDNKEMGQLAFKEITIDVLGSDYALVRGRFELRLNGTTATGLFTLILRKLPAGWRIVHDHTSV